MVPFDVPGHKRGRGNPELVKLLGKQCVELDVNSMKPLDNLCHPISVIKEAEELASKMENMTLEFKVNAKNGVVFNSVSTKQIQDALRKQGIVIDKRKIIDHEPITSLGYNRVKIELYKAVIGTIKVLLKE